MVKPNVKAVVATVPPVAVFTAAYLRCEDAFVAFQTCKALATDSFRSRYSVSAREAQRLGDIIEFLGSRRAHRRVWEEALRSPGDDSGSFTSSSSEVPSIGFSVDSDGPWHEHDDTSRPWR